MTKQNQQDNPKFAFLFAYGEHHDYYMFRVATEQQCMKRCSLPTNIHPIPVLRKMSAAPMPPAAPPTRPPPHPKDAEINALLQQVAESDQNLRAQRDALNIQIEVRVL
jgi:hypothetical protein